MANNNNRKSCLNNFLLDHPQPWRFYGPKCGLPMSIYTVYRVLIALYFVIFYVCAIVFRYGKQNIPQMAYAAMWSYLLQTIALFIKMVITSYKAVKTKCLRPDQTLRGTYSFKMSWILKTEWALHTITTVIPIMTVITYWSNFSEYNRSRFVTEPQISYFTIQCQGVNGVVALLDVFMSAIPIQLCHFYLPMLVQVFYVAFRYIFYAATGISNIDGLDHVTDVKSTFTELAISELVTLATFVIIWLINALQTKCCKPKGPIIDIRDFGIYNVETPLLSAAIPYH
ncbi:hypothetical protein CHUAL_003783 [Chamberlinius hualienensis]